MTTPNAGRVLFALLLALTLYLMYLIFKPLLPGIAWAIVLAVAFRPLYDRLVRWLRGWEWTSAVILSALVAAFIVVPAILAVVKIASGVSGAYQWLDAQVTAGAPGTFGVDRLPFLRDALDWAGQYIDLGSLDLRKMALSVLQTVGGIAASKTSGLVANALSTMVALVVMLVTMTALLHEGPALAAFVRQFLPLSEKEKDEVFRQLRSVTRAVFFGVILTALVQAIAGSIGVAIVGLPSALAFGAAMFFAAILPAGTVIVWGPAAVWLLVAGHPWKALILLLWGVLVVSSVDNFLRPLFIGKGVQMSTLLVFLGLFGGLLAFGLVGIFIGPLVITLFLFLLEVTRKTWLEAPAESKPGIAVERRG